MVNVLNSGAVNRRFESQSGESKEYKIAIITYICDI